MEKEVLEVFSVAKRAGEAAAADGGSPEVARCLDALKQLRKLPLTTKELVATKVGKGILCLTRHPEKKIQTIALELRQYWKDLVIEEASNSKKKSSWEGQASPQVGENSDKAVTVKVERVQSSGAMRVDGVPKSQCLKSERNGMHENISESGSVKIKNSVKVESIGNDRSGDKSIKVDKVTREEKQSPIFHPPKLTSMLKCNDELRDKFRETIAEALSKVHSEAPEEMKDEVAACDPIRVAVSVESLMFEKLGRSNGAQKAKYRSIMFNIERFEEPRSAKKGSRRACESSSAHHHGTRGDGQRREEEAGPADQGQGHIRVRTRGASQSHDRSVQMWTVWEAEDHLLSDADAECRRADDNFCHLR